MSKNDIDKIATIEKGIESLIKRVGRIPEKTGMLRFRKTKAMENLRLAKKACDELLGRIGHQ